MTEHYENQPYDLPEEEIEYVSKSEMKREAQRMVDLGKALTELNPNRWAKLPISDLLKHALEENVRLRSHEAKRRHLNYIGKLIWKEDIEAIKEGMDLIDPSSQIYGRNIKQQEMWRERLVNDPEGLNAFIEQFPNVDRQQLRNLTRNAQKEMHAESGDSPYGARTNYKKLFQFIKEQQIGD